MHLRRHLWYLCDTKDVNANTNVQIKAGYKTKREVDKALLKTNNITHWHQQADEVLLCGLAAPFLFVATISCDIWRKVTFSG